MRNRFSDPVTGNHYEWAMNHQEEEEFGKRRSIEHTAPTGVAGNAGVGLVRQQGDDAPLLIRLKGTILDPAQHFVFIFYFELSRKQSVYFRDFTGAEYEVIITSFLPTRERVLRNPRGGAQAPGHIWRYTMDMDVLKVRSGVWAAVTP